MGHLKPSTYIGRFAPSPTGLLHAGSLLAAVASYCDAKANRGQWLVRMEDLDPPREMAGAKDAILHTLESYGLHWDGDVWYQSQRLSAYHSALEQLLDAQQAYYCTCSRKPLLRQYGPLYPGLCRGTYSPPNAAYSVRVLTEDIQVHFEDTLQGPQHTDLANTISDFIVKRKDGLFAYHLAVVIDDAAQGITDIVRGVDLLDTTPCHVHLQQLLGLPTPTYSHIPVIVGSDQVKLSKQTFAEPIPSDNPSPHLWRSLVLLNLNPPECLKHEKCDTILKWGVAHWERSSLQGLTTLTTP